MVIAKSETGPQHHIKLPQGNILTTNGTWHNTSNGSRFQQFKTHKCRSCPVMERCTTSGKNGKIVQRRLYAENIHANRIRIESEPETYRKRQAIVEHPFGTIKRQWGFSNIITKKYLEHADGDVGIMMTAYNLRRLINITGIPRFREYLAHMPHPIFVISGYMSLKKTILAHYQDLLKKTGPAFFTGINYLSLVVTVNPRGCF